MLNSIERRVEQLAYRIDEALNRPQPTPKLDVKPIEDLTRRIDQALSRPQPAPKLDVKPIEDLARRIDEALSRPQPVPKLDASVEDLARRIDEALSRPQPAAKLDVKRIEDLTRRIDEALSRPRPAPMLDVKPIEDLARRVDSVRAALERQGDFRPQAAKLEAALADISLKLDRAPADAAIPHELNSTLQTLAARLEDAFRKPAPAPSPDARPIEDLRGAWRACARAWRAGPTCGPIFAKLESALNELAAKIDQQAPRGRGFPGSDRHDQDLADRIDRGASRVLDTAPIERLGEQSQRASRRGRHDADPGDVARPRRSDRGQCRQRPRRRSGREPVAPPRDRTRHGRGPAAGSRYGAIQQILREIGDGCLAARPGFDPAPLEDILHRIDAKLDAVDSRPVEIDTGPIERMLAEFGERFSANSAATIDTAPIEHAIRDIRDRLDSIEAPAFDYRRIEDAADLIAQRLESRGGLNVDAEALVDQIAEIHTRLDSLSSSSGSAAVLERAVGDLAAELDSIRALVIKSAALDPAIPVALVDEIAGLKNEQANSDRRMAARLASVTDIVEKLAERLQEIEQDGPAAVAAERSIQEPVASSSAILTRNRDLRDIPDRVGSAARSASQAVSSVAASPMGLSGANESTSFLLEPGAAAPRAKRAADDELPAAGKPNDIQAHIRGGAPPAMAEMSSRRERGDTESNSQPSRIAQGLSALKQAQALVTGKRVPFLVGASLLVVAAAAAVIELRAPRAPAVQK